MKPLSFFVDQYGSHHPVTLEPTASSAAVEPTVIPPWLAAPAKQPILTLELSPPKGTDPTLMLKKACSLVGWVDAINVPDCQRALLRMSSMVAAALIQQASGLPTVWQLTGRDRNLIALQADLLGGQALGLTSVLALTGDPVAVGDQAPIAKQVSHLEAVAILKLIAQLNTGADAVGKPFRHQGTTLTSGAALNPTALSSKAQQTRLCHKLEAGIAFFQTQPVYQADAIESTVAAVAQAVAQVGCPAPRLLIGMVPPKSAQMARFLNTTVPGIDIPSSLLDRLEASADPLAESMAFYADLAQRARGLVDGFHLMPVSSEKYALAFAQTIAHALGRSVDN
jgi:methylenetetrahydrofolate reductase (NADPH)